MSRWTHVIGAICIDIYEDRKDAQEYVKNTLKKAPKITGSEKDADVFVNVLSGHNTWTNCDCEHCEYGKTIVHLEEGGFQCDAQDDYECPEGEYQTHLTITIMGDLRDRDGNTTCNEINKFLKFIEKQGRGWEIDYYSISVYDDYVGKYTLTEKTKWSEIND